jgi:Uma2 family endonuclease
MTAEELSRLPERTCRSELVRGALRELPFGNAEHGALIMRVAIPLGAYVMSHKLGVVFGAETGFVLTRRPDTVLAPDVAYVRNERIPAAGLPTTFWEGAPDFAVEVVSPSDTYVEVEEKVASWLELGTRMVWVVNPKRRTVTVHRPQQTPSTFAISDTLDGEDVISGFRLPVSTIFS